jgi:hypothetical protein
MNEALSSMGSCEIETYYKTLFAHEIKQHEDHISQFELNRVY